MSRRTQWFMLCKHGPDPKRSRSMHRWTALEEHCLMVALDAGVRIDELANIHRRNKGAIAAKMAVYRVLRCYPHLNLYHVVGTDRVIYFSKLAERYTGPVTSNQHREICR